MFPPSLSPLCSYCSQLYSFFIIFHWTTFSMSSIVLLSHHIPVNYVLIVFNCTVFLLFSTVLSSPCHLPTLSGTKNSTDKKKFNKIVWEMKLKEINDELEYELYFTSGATTCHSFWTVVFIVNLMSDFLQVLHVCTVKENIIINIIESANT